MSDTEILSDDDVAVVVDQIIDLDKVESAKSPKSKSKHIETVVIDDERHSQSDNNNVTKSKNNITLDINSIYGENQLLAEFIEKCINLENTSGMLKTINRCLLRVYEETSKEYRNSSEFEKILQRQINLIETKPHKKFCHMKTIIDALKSGFKKRVKLTTLATNLKSKHNKRFAHFGEREVKRSKKEEIIDLDSEPNDIIPVINLDEDPNEVIILDAPVRTRLEKKENIQISSVNNGDENKIDGSDNCRKNSQNDSEENSYLKQAFVPNSLRQQSMITETLKGDENDIIVLDAPAMTKKDNETEDMQFCALKHADINKTDNNHNDNDYELKNSQNDSEESSYLTPQIELFVPNNVTEQQSTVKDQQSIVKEPVERHLDHNYQINGTINVKDSAEEDEHRHVQEEIRNIESEIDKCKQIILHLEEIEVTTDNFTSPYIISEKIKAKIVSLYKRLCELTGSEVVKKRTVRLQVQDGHPAGPVRRLEDFINSNIGDDGDPQFPDFGDVTMCVLQANEADGLGWNKTQILKEATALFTQCGRALQKRRQKREWRDLLATAKTETIEYDPADEDPVLQAKLEQNRWVAQCKENDLLDRYSKMQEMSAQAKLNKMNRPSLVTVNGIRMIDTYENINPPNEANIITVVPIVNKENGENEAKDDSNVSNTVQNSLVMIKTEVAVEFEPPENVEMPDDSKESLNLDVKNMNYLPCTQSLQMEEAIENGTNETNVKHKTEIDNVQSSENNCSGSVDNENYQSYELAASSKNNPTNVNSDNSKNTYLTVNRSEENSQEDISEKQHDTVLKNGAGDMLVNEEVNNTDKVEIKKEPVDVAASIDCLGVTNYLSCTQRLQMEEAAENDSIETNVKSKNEIDNVQSSKNYCSGSFENENYPSCELSAFSKNNTTNVNSDNSTNAYLTVNRNEENSQEDISEKQHDTVLKNGAGDILVDKELNNTDKVKIKKEPVDIAALLDGLGDNFSADIVDIEDPFLVIEISDSSDEEE